jgi:hypothetical protein
MFGRRGGHGSFSQLLRSAGKGNSIQKPVPMTQPGAKPEKGGSAGNRRPDNASTQRHMDAKTSAGHQPGGTRISHGSKKAWVDKPSVRIAEGSPGTSGREIHKPNKMERAGKVPAEHLIGARRTKFGKSTTSKKLGTSGMSSEVSGRPGVPGHESVINRGPKGRGGRKVSYGRRAGLARKLQY